MPYIYRNWTAVLNLDILMPGAQLSSLIPDATASAQPQLGYQSSCSLIPCWTSSNLHSISLNTPVITLTAILITTNLLILLLLLIHQLLQLRVIILRHRLRRHLHRTIAPSTLDIRRDILNRRLQHRDALTLIQRLTRQHIQWRTDQLDLNLRIRRVPRLSRPERRLDRIDPLVSETSDLDVGADFRGLRRQALADVARELFFSDRRGEFDLGPHVWVGDAELEGVDRVAVFLVQGPADRAVQVFDGRVGLFGYVAHDAVHHFGLVVALFALDDIFGGDAAFGEIDVAWSRISAYSLHLVCSVCGQSAPELDWDI